MKKMFGITTAMVTPFTDDDKVDYDALAAVTKMLISSGVHCLFPCGTTGEMFRLSVDERKKAAETIIKTANGKTPVFMHCGTMNQKDTIELAQHAESSGADGIGVITPVFFGQSRRELEEYFTAVANSVPKLPVYLYNIPQYSSNDVPVEVVQNVAKKCPNIIGIKYSYADPNLTIDYLNINDGTFSVLHGLDRAMVAFLAMGCDGVVSGVSCVFPEPFVEGYNAYVSGDLAKAQKLQKTCVKFCDALKRGSNMSYFKEGLKIRGINAGNMRKPQLDIDKSEITNLKAELESICKESNINISFS